MGVVVVAASGWAWAQTAVGVSVTPSGGAISSQAGSAGLSAAGRMDAVAPAAPSASVEPVHPAGDGRGLALQGGPDAVVPSEGRSQRSPSTADGQDAGTDAVSGVPRVRDSQPTQSEFQRFVAEHTGFHLPRFGEGLFVGRGSTFAPLDQVPVPADYVLGPGDELLVRAWGAVDLELRTRIDRNGLVNIPRVGPVRVAGLRASEVEGYLTQQVGRLFRNFQLNVTLGQLRSIQVFVVGQARRPGQYTVSSLSTLMNAVFASGGPAVNGSMRRIQLRRAGAVVAELDLYDFLLKGDLTNDRPLLPGDTIVYLPQGPQVALIGATDKPAVYELRGETETLGDILRYSGGLSPVTSTHQVQVERVDPQHPRSPRHVMMMNLDAQGLAAPVRAGDVVTLFRVTPEFANAVTLRGNVAAPLRYPYQPGMRVSDLIPEREALLTVDYHIRLNRLVQYLDNGKKESKATETTRNLVDEPNWEYAVIERLNRQTLQLDLLPFNLRRAVVERDPVHDLPLQPGDVVTIYGARDVALPQSARVRLVRVEGEIVRPGVYQLRVGETLHQLLQRAGGATPLAYLYGMELSRESARRKQREAIADAVRRLEAMLASEAAGQLANLSGTDAQAAVRLQAAQAEARRAQLSRLRGLEPNGRIALEVPETVVQLSEVPDVMLEDGDRIYIPARPDFVFVAGAVANSNTVLWQQRRTVGDYLKLAGLEPGADEDNIFIVRANGTVVHRRDGGLFSSRFERTTLMPGDVVIVPEKLDRESTWSAVVRGLKDWTQILYQFGLAAAAIETLRK